MKFLDKFLNALKTDRNTFFTYILTLITAYLIIDRVVEILFMCTTGMSVSYWGPIKYTLAMACPVFAFLFSYSSKFIKSDENKFSFFYVYCIALYIIGISMFIQWVNYLGWFSLLSVSNYKEIFMNFSYLVKPAFNAIAIYIPLVTFYKLFFWLYRTINDPIFPNNYKDSIVDFSGLDISSTPPNVGPYSFETTFCNDKITGKPVKILEKRRFESTLIVGPSGTGKSALIMEPLIARDLEKKLFFRETAKEMGYTALKTGIATLSCPYSKDYLNKNFTLKMLTPVEGKENVYKAYMNKMIYATNGDKIIYKDLGLTSITPDPEQTFRIADVAKNLNIPVHILDPFDANSIGINPFTISNPALCALTISLVIKGLFGAREMGAELAYMEDIALQAVQNIVILLKVVFPKLNNDLMPTLEDLLKCFNNFDLVESMCKELEKDTELSKQYELQIGYFKQYFYKDSKGKENTQRYLQLAASQLDVLLRAASIRNIVCNRNNNIDLLNVIENGEIVLLCTRANDIGGTAHKGFGKFFLWLFMIAVESRLGNENTRTPYFLYIDDFNMYADGSFTDTFTQFRKYKVGTIFSVPNLSSIDGGVNSSFAQALLTNAPTKISFGNCTPEDYDWWEREFGERKEWKYSHNYAPGEGSYEDKMGSIAWDYKNILRKAKIQGLKFKQVVYKTKDKNGKNLVSFGNVDFLASKYKEPKKIKNYNFDKFNVGILEKEASSKDKPQKFNPKKVSFGTSDENDDVNPIQTDTTDSKFFFDNEDAISFNLNKKNDN